MNAVVSLATRPGAAWGARPGAPLVGRVYVRLTTSAGAETGRHTSYRRQKAGNRFRRPATGRGVRRG
jgi:hypothetical protein